MKRLMTFLRSFFLSFGIESLFYIIINLFIPDIFDIKLLWALATMTSVTSLCGSFIFKKGLQQKELWIRRIIIIIISCIVITTTMILFDIITFGDLAGYIVYISIVSALILLASIIVYTIADKIEKETIRKINDKLKLN